MDKGDRLTLTIERPAAGGRMIARHEGAVVFVAGAIPGETVHAEVERVQRGLVWAVARDVLEPSTDRIVEAPDLDCGGNVLAHVRYERQLAIKREIIEDSLRRIGHLTPPRPIEVAASPIDGYRMRARLHLRGGRIGFFREATHNLCEPRQTRQLLPEAVDAVHRLGQALEAVDSTLAAEVDLSENIPATERACHVEITRGRVGARLARQLKTIDGLTGASFSLGGETRTRELWGSPFVTDTLSVAMAGETRSMSLVRHARAFFQGNRFVLEPLVQHVRSTIAPGFIVDLYAGVGLFSIDAVIAGHGHALAIEGDDVAAANLRRNAAQCAGDVRVRSESVEEFLAGPHANLSPTTVIVDPPRSGIAKEALAGVQRLQAPRLVYVSCDVATLARDARLLTEGGYTIDAVTAFDLFPQTAHVETVIVFSR
ncbi:MAG: class I SAM-dependent RNA methyltransferase [Vicinamibacterales bacterium]